MTWYKALLKNSVIVLLLAMILYFILPTLLSRKTKTKLQDNNQPIQTDKNHQNHQNQMTRLRLISLTSKDLAEKLGIPQSDINLKSVTNKLWKDNSLECLVPLNGSPLVSVPQIREINGWLIAFNIGNTVYEYNTSVNGDWILCSKIEIPQNIAVYRSPADR